MNSFNFSRLCEEFEIKYIVSGEIFNISMDIVSIGRNSGFLPLQYPKLVLNDFNLSNF